MKKYFPDADADFIRRQINLAERFAESLIKISHGETKERQTSQDRVSINTETKTETQAENSTREAQSAHKLNNRACRQKARVTSRTHYRDS